MLSRMTDEDYEALLKASWHGVRSAANTRTKVGQVPRLLISIEYKPGIEFQFGNLLDYVKTAAANGKPEKEWSSPDDYMLDLSKLMERLGDKMDKVEKVRYEKSPDVKFKQEPDWSKWSELGIDA
jgi:CRISPR-associated protein Csh2